VAVLGGGKHEEGGGGELRGVAVRSSAEHEEARHCPASFGKGRGDEPWSQCRPAPRRGWVNWGEGKELEAEVCAVSGFGGLGRKWEIALARLFWCHVDSPFQHSDCPQRHTYRQISRKAVFSGGRTRMRRLETRMCARETFSGRGLVLAVFELCLSSRFLFPYRFEVDPACIGIRRLLKTG
jgi:hypothetical protein